MYQYLPIQNEVFSPEIGKYRTFGLRVLRIQDGKDQEIMIFSDVSTDFLFTLRLASLLAEKQLDPLHLLDVLSDII